MYKDVKKKLLSVVLCVCMVIGAVQVVPRVKAATDTATYTKDIVGSVSGVTGTKTFRVTYQGQSFTYNGMVQKPKLQKVEIIEGATTTDVTDECAFSEGSVNAGTYNCYLEGTFNSGYSFEKSSSNAIAYTISKATIASIKVNYDEDKVLKYSASGVTPEIFSLTVTLNDSTRTQLTLTDQYTITSLDKVGYDQVCTVAITGDNFDEAGTMITTINCSVAYDLAKSDQYYVAFEDGGSTDYTGNVITPVLNIYSKDGSVLTRIDSNVFTIKYNNSESTQIRTAGTYTVEVTPKMGADHSCLVGTNIFTGTYTGTYTVGEKQASDLIVYSDSADGSKRVKLTGANKEELTLQYNNGNSVEPQNVVVQDASGNTIPCTITYENSTMAGTAYMYIEPQAGTNYTGKITVEYFIVSSISISTIGFTSYNPNVTDLIYSGDPLIPSIVTVINASGLPLKKGETWHYVITYNYQDAFGNYQAEELSETAAATSPNMATSGTKRIRISGRGKYTGQVYDMEYRISAVSIANHPDWFSLTLDKNSFYYDGTPKKPKTIFTYKDTHIIPESEYTVEYTNNTNIGTATVTVTANKNSNYEGSVSTTFSIMPVSISYAVITDAPFTYNRTAVRPTIAIQSDAVYGTDYSYQLTEGTDYHVDQYMDADGTALSSAPTACGEYSVQITNLNTKNISGTTKVLPFKIEQADINTVTGFQLRGVNGDDREIEWNGGDTKPELIGSALTPEKDYTYEYKNCSTVTTTSGASVVITGQGNYTGTKTLYYTITRRSFTGSSNSDFTIAATPSGKVSDSDGYKIKLTVKDAARSPESAQTLKMGTDYQVQMVEYFNDLNEEWEILTTSDYATDNSSDTIKNVYKAGKYRITVEGIGNYQDTLQVTRGCGTDISNYYVGINETGTYISYPYTGSTVTPSAFILYTQNGNKTSIAEDCYTIDYERRDTYTEKLVDIGIIYVIGVGVPEQGYYGRTQIKEDNKKGYYTITAPKWNSAPFTLTVNPSSVKFAPNNGTDIPKISVTFNGKDLVEGSDYELIYNEAQLRTAGSKRITVRGINNYEDSANVRYADYVVEQVDISEVTVVPGEASYNGGRPGITLSYLGYTLVEGKDNDYTANPIPDPTTGEEIIKGNDGKYYITYRVNGKGNFTGERTDIKIAISVSGLSESDADFADSKDTAQVGQYYVIWQDDECVISSEQAKLKESERTAVKPKTFTIVYKKSETSTTRLEEGKDYSITGYGPNVTPGVSDANYVVIQGINGYSGTRQLKFKLYTDISGAQTTTTSLIRNDSGATTPTVITKQKWQEVYEQEGEHGLVELANLSFDETEGVINTDEYNLRWSKGFNIANPAVGTATLTIVGAQKESHYYSKSFDIQFTIVNGLEGAVITVNGESNSIGYNGSPVYVTASGISFIVKVDDVTLKRGTDYEIKGYENNDRIGEATVRIEGIGNYAGEAEHQFKITYPLNQLVVYMETDTGSFVNTADEQVRYPYKAKDITPRIHVYCPLDLPSGTTDYNSITPLSETSYTVEYENNRNAGTANVVIKDAQYFTGDTQRKIPFIIDVASICPPGITYTTSKGSSVDNIRVTYAGKDFSASDLGIELLDKGTTLVSGNSGDYVIYYTGDTRNVTKAPALPGITFVGVNNYTDSHSINFTILEKSLGDSDIVANDSQPLDLIYSGTDISEEVKGKLNVIFTGAEKLVCDTDYTIEGYYTDNLCRIRVVDSDNNPVAPSARGTYYVKLTGIGNYNGEKVVQVNVGKKDMSSGLKISFIASEACPLDAAGEPICIYNGSAHEPKIVVTYGKDVVLTENTDYSVVYDNNTNASDATTVASVTVTALPNSNYDGSVTRNFTIQPKNIAQLDTAANTMYYSSLEESYPFTGNSVEPAMVVRDGETNQTLVSPTDYTIDYTSEYKGLEIANGAPEHSYAGLVTMTITGQGNYTGTQEFTYYIGEDISKSYTLVNGRSSVSTDYNGLEQAPDINAITVVWQASSDQLDASKEARYEIAYYKNGFEKSNLVTRDQIIDAATYYVAIVGVPSKGTYAKTSVQNSCAYTINPRSIAPSYILVSGYDGTYYYTGQPIEPKGITVEDTDLPVKNDPTDPQRRSVKLVNGTDFDISYTNNISAGKASIVVAGKGNYTGSRAAYFNIVSSDTSGNNTWDGTSEGTGSITDGTTTIAASDIILGYDNSTYNCMMYNGYERIPTVSINGASTSEFIITASNNVRPGVATLMITGRGNNYTGTIIKNYTIKANLSSYGTVGAIADQNYTGYQVTPYVTVTCGGNLLTQGHDYTLTYANNTNVGRATVIATATADSYYLGTATGYFNISNTATGMEITGYASSYTYTGNAITPDVIVTMNGRVLNRGTDYTVTYSNNTNVGTATMTVTGIGSFSGTKTINYVIEARNIENCITTAVNNYQYTGNTYTPAVTLTDASTGKALTAGTDYTITYSNNTNPGTASITVTALGRNYTGSKVISFKITSAAVSGLRVSKIKNNSMRLSWSDQDYADGYQICNANNRVIGTTTNNSYTVKKLTSCTTYRYKVRSYVENEDGSVSYGSFSTAVSAQTMLNTPTLKARSVSRGKVTLTWTKVAKASGYEIYYSTEKNGIYTKLKTVSKSSARKYVDAGLASGEKYFYTIRAYRTVNGVKTYSSYNTIKSATVK